MGTGAYTEIGILGGTFNPVHMGHLMVAQAAAEQLDLAKVLFVPCATPPHKEASSLLSAEHRMAMLETAVQDNLRFELCDIEVRRGGPSYTIDTVSRIRRSYPAAALDFIIGSDTLPELHLWKDIYKLLGLCRFVTFLRPGAGMDSLRPEDLELDAPWPARLLQDVVTGHLVDVSSSDIRHRIAEGMSIRYLVPPEVEMYIAEHGLYGG